MLPPGPSAPAFAQTCEWVARPTALMRRCAARYGEPFTLRTLWTDGPMVFLSDPADVKRVFTADPAVMRAGESSKILEPLAGSRSILVLDEPEHMPERKRMLPPFHGAALARWRDTIAGLAAAELDAWRPGEPIRTHPRMQALTLEVIQRVILGGPDPELRDAMRTVLDMGASLPRMVALSLSDPGRGAWRSFDAAVARFDALLERRMRDAPDDGSVLAVLRAAGEGNLRDQLVTLLVAGHETTAGALAWGLERLARHPHVLDRLREDEDDAYLDAVVKEVLRSRPVLSIVPRKLQAPFEVGGWTLPPGAHVTPCIYLAHRRADVWGDPLAFRPERFLDGAPEPYAFLPFGGGVRRCAGAAFATLEMREVLRALAARFALRPDRPEGERMRRRAVTLTPARGGRVIPQALASGAASRCRSSAVTTA